jgi:parallel beta-helix repeat protein
MRILVIVIFTLILFTISYSSPTEAQATFTCSSCSECSDYLQNGSISSGGTLMLTSDITGQVGNCIEFGGADDITFDCGGFTISGDGDNSGYGFWLNQTGDGSNNNTIINCPNVSHFYWAFYLYSSDNNSFYDITAISNYRGLTLYLSDSNTLSNFTANSNSVQGLYISFSQNNILTNITASNNLLYGIAIYSNSDYNTITRSTVEHNFLGGVYLYHSGSDYPQYNLIYNNYLNNTLNLNSTHDSNTNYWNTTLDCASGPNVIGGNCIGGNYWTDPDGFNFSDTCTDIDANEICDSSYILDSGNTDELPLHWNKIPPLLEFVPPTPDDGWASTEQDWIFINVSSNEPLSSCILDWNGTNESITPDNSLCYINKTNLNDGNLTYRVYASDAKGNLNSTETRKASIDIGDITLPVIDNYQILPILIPYGDPVQIGVNASDDEGIDEVWANITDPSGAYHHVVLLNNDYVQWPTNVVGTYNITIFAEDTSFNVVNVSDIFYVEDLVYINITVLDFNDDGVSTDIDVFVSGTLQSVYTGHDSDGEFNVSLVEHEYDLLFMVFSDDFELLLRKVSLSSGFNKGLGLDEPPPQDNFEYIYSVETDYPFDDARIRIFYEDMNFDNETNIKVYTCEDWDFDGQECDDDWDELDNITLNTDDECAEFNVSNFSAFAVREDSYCGDGWCGPGETTDNCPDDCFCDDGDTRPCNIAHQGSCAQGTETCSGNLWSGCPGPIDESCNMVDDDCDGVVDNVDGGTSISATKCQCYNDGSPLSESCNGIDDNCDGLIDNNADCCNDGQTRECGPSSEVGECEKGTVSCSGGTWSSSCVGAVFPQNEICGDQKDNDCDGQTDEGCQVPNCDEGQITDSCTCEGSARSSGYCCAGVYSEEECVENSWWILIVLGVVILVVITALVIYFKSKGKELTWEELMQKYRPPSGGQPQ